MKLLFSGQVPKDASFPEANEDAIAVALDEGRVAISDGASESFDSKTLAHLLVGHFQHCPVLSSTWLMEVIADYESHFDVTSLSWSKRAAFDRGSFATLLGIEHYTSLDSLNVVAVGDSLAVLVEDTESAMVFPYAHSRDFQQRPQLVSTKASLNALTDDQRLLGAYRTTWLVRGRASSRVLCMTDALGEWALRCAEEGCPKWSDLTAITALSDLETLVARERGSKRMRVDDVTLVTLSLGD
jgi:hypothetical protein